MKKFLLYDTDEGLDFNIPCIPSDLPWVSCRVFRVLEEDNMYFEVIKSEEYLVTDIVKEKSVGTFESFQHAIETAEMIAHAYRAKSCWPMVKRVAQ
jgi:hypothetical protein